MKLGIVHPYTDIEDRTREVEELSRAEEFERSAYFLAAWQDFERASKETLAEHNSNLNLHSPRVVISRLTEAGKIDWEDAAVLEEGLKARNLIVHGGRRVSAEIAERLTTSLVEIVRKITAPVSA
ncbi:MAG: hypothetical protein OXI87_00775 [Albidovulum sp.]|nr:hypothetical protein [Albidovulum sp.]